jgi:hypothetical protein
VPEIIESRVIPWDGFWGVAIRYANRTRVAYPVGSREDAERELLDPRPPWPEPVPDGRSGVGLNVPSLGADARPNWRDRPERPTLTGTQWSGCPSALASETDWQAASITHAKSRACR